MARLWTAQFVSVMGDFLALFAILSVASFRLHGTPEQLTLISLFYMLPMAVIGPVAGVFVDRWNVKTTMISSDLIRCVLAFGLIFANSLTSLYVLLFAISLVSTFFSPAQSVTVRTIVPTEGLLNANALMMQAFLVTRIVSPALAGALVGAFGPNVCFFYDGISFLFSAAILSTISINRVAVQAGKGFQAVFQDLRSGMAFLFHSPVLSFVILAMGAGMFVMSCFGPLIAIYVRDFLSAGSATFGVLSALIGVGMLVGTVGLRKFGMKIPSEQMVLIGLVLIGLSVLLMAVFQSVAMTAIATFGMGFGIAFIITPAQVLMQGKTPPQLLGRVSSSFMSVIAIAQLLGLVISGNAAGWIGIQGLFFACALLLGILALGGYWRMPRVAQS